LILVQKVSLLVLALFLNSCSLESFIALGEVDKVQVVKQNASCSQYRAYFTRTRLKPIKKNQKYLYFYNKKKRDFAVLLHPFNRYILYSFYHPKSSHIVLDTRKHMPYWRIRKKLRKLGYVLSSPHAVAATSKVGLRKYKGIKTLLIEITDYSALQKKYQKAIRSYKADTILELETELPQTFIHHFFKRYLKKASTNKQKEQLNLIADKLHLKTKKIIKHDNSEEKRVQKALAKEVPEEVKPLSAIPKSAPFEYYATKASYTELEKYLNNSNTKNIITPNQYTQLEQRYIILKDEKILKHGSLETLISEYKMNKNPKYKQRILELMKTVQSQSRPFG